MAIKFKWEVYEILEKVAKTRLKKDKIAILHQHNAMPIRDVLRGTFDRTVQWNVPDGNPPYEPADESSVPSSLTRQHLHFKYFVKGLRDSERLNKIKRERMFINMLESVHPRDAEILISMINKKSPMKGITKKLIQEAFPDLIVK